MVEASYLKIVSRFIGYFVLCSIFIGFLLALSLDADTVPFWCFYDVISLLSHLPLATVGMPGQSAVFLSTMASMLRFSLFGVDKRIAEYFGVDFEIRTTTELQRQAGYTSCYLLVNLFVLLSSIIVVTLIYCISKIIRSVSEYKPGKPPVPNGRTEV